MGGDESGYIPKSLDAMERFLFWEMDQAIMAILLTGIGVVSSAMILGMFAGVLAAWGYGKLKAGKHPRFAVHVLYWWLPSRQFVKSKITPPSDQRYFLG